MIAHGTGRSQCIHIRAQVDEGIDHRDDGPNRSMTYIFADTEFKVLDELYPVGYAA